MTEQLSWRVRVLEWMVDREWYLTHWWIFKAYLWLFIRGVKIEEFLP